jgi:hypothetical protein
MLINSNDVFKEYPYIYLVKFNSETGEIETSEKFEALRVLFSRDGTINITFNAHPKWRGDEGFQSENLNKLYCHAGWCEGIFDSLETAKKIYKETRQSELTEQLVKYEEKVKEIKKQLEKI